MIGLRCCARILLKELWVRRVSRTVFVSPPCAIGRTAGVAATSPGLFVWFRRALSRSPRYPPLYPPLP